MVAYYEPQRKVMFSQACFSQAESPSEMATAAEGTHPTGMHSC